MIRDRQDVARFLVARGCKADLLMAAALGDQPLAERLLAADPECIRLRVSGEYFPMINHKSGGTIYQWTLGWYKAAPQIALEFGHPELARWLMERSPATLQLVNACWLHDDAAVESLLSHDPQLSAKLADSDRRQLAHAARNNDLHAVQLFLRAGLPVDARGQHQATALHWAAWHGNVAMVEAILARHPPLEAKDADFQGTPMAGPFTALRTAGTGEWQVRCHYRGAAQGRRGGISAEPPGLKPACKPSRAECRADGTGPSKRAG